MKVGNLGGNIISNGDFEQGNTGFTTNYTVGSGGSWGPVSNPGTYLITTSPNVAHTNFSSCTDHTPNPGVNMFVVNGASTPNTNVWCQTVPVQQNTSYQFGTWVSSALNDPTVAQLQFNINSSSIGPIFSPSSIGCSWSQFFQTWNSGLNTSAQICITNQNVSGGGNDFVLDDITFKPICFAYDTIHITVSPKPIVNLGPDINTCSGTPVVLDAGNPGLNFTWSTTETSQQINPTSSGNYSVTVSNPYNCTGTDNINVFFEVPKSAGGDSAIVRCQTATTIDLNTLKNNSAFATGIWSTTDFTGNFNTNGNIVFAGETGQYHFKYVVSGTYCPNDTANFTLQLNAQPVAANNASLHICNTLGSVEDISSILNHPQDPSGDYWNYSANFPVAEFDEASNTIQTGNLVHGNYILYNILSADSMCVQDTFQLSLKITAVPQVDFSASKTEGCTPVSVSFENQSITQGSITALWDIGDGTTSTNLAGLNTTYSASVCYDVTLTLVADELCSATLTKPAFICVHPIPVANFTYNPQQVFSDGPIVKFDNNSTDNTFNQWSFGDGENSTAIEPEHTYPIGDIGNYEVELIVISEFGCSDTTRNFVVVKDQLLFYVPNSFTPDGDQFNSIFIPVLTAGIDLNDYNLVIFDRWGEIVFETKDTQTGWDGTVAGFMSNGDTYIWKIEFGLIDNDVRKQLSGHVNLIR